MVSLQELEKQSVSPAVTAKVATTQKAPQPNKSGGNDLAGIKAKLQSIMVAEANIKEEREHIKDVLKELQDQHQLKPKVSKKVIKLMTEGTKDYEDEFETVTQWVQKLTQ